MITTVAAFLVSISVLGAVAAWMGEEGVRRLGGPTRWVWLAALAAGPLLLVAAMLLPERPASAAAVIGPAVELAPIVLGSGAATNLALNELFGAAWALLSLGLSALLLWTSFALRKSRSRWEHREVQGRSVYISGGRGPAVAGFLRPWIVLPQWALSLPEPDLGLVILHEEEHVRAGDSVLLGLALSLVIVTPWNPITWWQLRRLRGAMEMDCDRRVLRREPDRERYGQSLLSVAERSSGPSLGLAAFSERPLSLERRIIAMTWKNSRWTPVKAGLLILLAMVVAVQACGVAVPFADDPAQDSFADEVPAVEIPAGASETERDRELEEIQSRLGPEPTPEVSEPQETREPSSADRSEQEPTRTPTPRADPSEPSFTPFTVAPSILNRQEVIEAMQAAYPPLLRDAGIGGSVRVYFFINEDGVVENFRIDESSGHQALDDAALRVAGVYRFSSALNRTEKVPVWVSFPITFQVR